MGCLTGRECKESVFMAVLPPNLDWAGFWRCCSQSEHTDAAPSLAPLHWIVWNSLQIHDWLLSLGLPYALSQLTSCLCFIFHYFFSTTVTQMLGAESCSLSLSRGVILAFQLSFDAAPKRIAALGSNFCLLFSFIRTIRSVTWCQFSFCRGLISFNKLFNYSILNYY